MALTAYITATPLDSGFFKDIYSSLREFKSRFKERFELDHYMGGVVDDTDPTCEGYHKQLTMNGGEYNATNIPATIPACPTGGIVFFSIGGELCCYDGNTAKQLTEEGQIASELIYTSDSTSPNVLGGVAEGSGISVWFFSNQGLYSTTDDETLTLRLTAPGSGNSCRYLKYLNNRFIATFYGHAGYPAVYSAYAYYSTDGINWTQFFSYSSTTYNAVFGADYINGVYVVYANESILTSTNGTTWTERTCSAINGYGVRKIIYDGTNYVFSCPNRIYDPIQVMTSGNLTDNYETATFITANGAGSQTGLIKYNSNVILLVELFEIGYNTIEYRVLRSTDHGYNFSEVITGITKSEVFSLFEANGVFFVSGDILAYSIDDGLTWTESDVSRLNSEFTPSSFLKYGSCVYNQVENMILLYTNNKIICSYDNGLSWENNEVWNYVNLIGAYKNGFIARDGYYIKIFSKYITLE